jgi:hypothetical protein
MRRSIMVAVVALPVGAANGGGQCALHDFELA